MGGSAALKRASVSMPLVGEEGLHHPGAPSESAAPEPELTPDALLRPELLARPSPVPGRSRALQLGSESHPPTPPLMQGRHLLSLPS